MTWKLTFAEVHYGSSIHRLTDDGLIPLEVEGPTPEAIKAVAIGIGQRIGYTLDHRTDWKAEIVDNSKLRAKMKVKCPEIVDQLPDYIAFTSDGVMAYYEKVI